MNKALVVFLLLMLTCSTVLIAGESSSNWSISTSLTFPLARIYTLHLSYMFADNNELFFGPCFQNFSHDSFTVYAYTLILGYRHYFWKGLFAEAELYPAYNSIWSKVTESYYPGYEMWGEFKVGYKIPLWNSKYYLQPAPGIGFGFFRTNSPPNYYKEIESPIFIPQVIIGMEF